MYAQRGAKLTADPRYAAHEGPAGHPERPERISAVGAAVDAFGDALARRAPRPAELDELLAVHERSHVEQVRRAAAQVARSESEASLAQLDPDTFVGRASYGVALLAAGGCVDLALRVATGATRAGFAAVRPPGHHAEGDRAMGFCLFNNAAIAARAVQRAAGVERVLVLDWDVHHGNGTQHTFATDPPAPHGSTPQDP